MDRVPESLVGELIQWVAYERDAAWAAKLAILRVRRREDIALLGEVLREHDRHADELSQVVRASSPRPEVSLPDGPCFVTRDAFVIGALDREDAVLDALEYLELVRIERYEQRRRRLERTVPSTLDAVLERHLADARARLVALQRRRRSRSAVREAAA